MRYLEPDEELQLISSFSDQHIGAKCLAARLHPIAFFNIEPASNAYILDAPRQLHHVAKSIVTSLNILCCRPSLHTSAMASKLRKSVDRASRGYISLPPSWGLTRAERVRRWKITEPPTRPTESLNATRIARAAHAREVMSASSSIFDHVRRLHNTSIPIGPLKYRDEIVAAMTHLRHLRETVFHAPDRDLARYATLLNEDYMGIRQYVNIWSGLKALRDPERTAVRSQLGNMQHRDFWRRFRQVRDSALQPVRDIHGIYQVLQRLRPAQY